MTKERKPLRWNLRLSGKQLKLFGCATLFCYTLAASVLRNGLLRANLFAADELSALIEADANLSIMAGWTSVLQLIGSLSIPVFAFLLAEGFAHTSNLRRYILTLLAGAVVSEVPYDLAMYGKLFSLDGQNALFTCVIGLLMLCGLREFDDKKGIAPRLMQALFILAALLWTGLLRCAFGTVTLLLAAACYLLRERKLARTLTSCVLSVPYITAPLSGIALWSYSGERGNIRYKYLYYAFYPLHLLLLGLIACALQI